ncbi:MAG: peptidylprolyl isomerase, partial [Pseudobdellovibrionaceae bacterium]
KKAQVADNEVSNSLSDPEFMKKVESDFKDNKTHYSEREQVKASHILVKGDTPEALAKAKAKIEQIAKRLEKEDFAKVAKETSEDTGSKDRGGDLGFFGKGQMDPAFEGAAFALEPGKLSGPVTTQFGVHLIKVFDKKAAKEYTLDEKKNEIARKLIAQEKSKTLVKDLEAALKDGNEAAINTQVKNLGGVWDETGAFRLDTEMIPKVSPSPQIQKVVFDLRQDKPFSTALVSDGAAEYVFKLKSSRAVPTPSEDKTMIQQMTRERSSDVYRKWVDGLRKQAKIEVNPALMQGNEAAQ